MRRPHFGRIKKRILQDGALGCIIYRVRALCFAHATTEVYMHGKLLIKRIYLPASDDDGERCLVDRLWPRGIKKETAHIDAWMKDVAPSNEIRKDFNHEVEKFPAFRAAYKKELSKNDEAKQFASSCAEKLKTKNVTLLYGAKDDEHNNAVVLRDWILQKLT